jgi:signal peptidase I
MQRVVRFLAWTVGGLAVLGGLAYLLLFDVWTIPDDALLGASMQPTLAAGDTVLLLKRGTPAFGDLVRCPDPEDASRFVVGRIAGGAGDRIEVQGHTLIVNGRSYSSTEACKKPTLLVEDPSTGHTLELECSRVEMGSGWHFRATGMGPGRRGDGQKEVGTGRLFLLSDNREIHDDSRDFGTVPVEGCQLRVVFRLWSAKGWSDVESRFTVIR